MLKVSDAGTHKRNWRFINRSCAAAVFLATTNGLISRHISRLIGGSCENKTRTKLVALIQSRWRKRNWRDIARKNDRHLSYIRVVHSLYMCVNNVEIILCHGLFLATNGPFGALRSFASPGYRPRNFAMYKHQLLNHELRHTLFQV